MNRLLAAASQFVLMLSLAGTAAAAKAPDLKVQQLFAFACQGNSCPDGKTPNSLLQSADGSYYGTTNLGGSGNGAAGTVFNLASNGQFKTLYTFTADKTGNYPNGQFPNSLVEGNDGYFYGTTLAGGANQTGVLFRLSRSGQIKVLHNFCSLSNCADGFGPTYVLLGADGKFYGGSFGILFAATARGAFKSLHAFDTQTEGPTSLGMTLASDGNFYGTVVGGGSIFTTFFRLKPSGQFDDLDTFHYSQFPLGVPIQGFDGKLYGVLRFDANHDAPGFFTSGLGGKNFVAAALQTPNGDAPNYLSSASDGNLWGAAYSANDFPDGDVVVYSTDGSALQTIALDGSSGANPYSSLIQGSDGTLVGVAATGGTVGSGETGAGTVFAIDASLNAPAPAIAGFSPSGGGAGTKVTIHGTHFVGSTDVAFNGVSASFQVLNTGNVLATVPQGASSGALTVTNPGGTIASRKNFTVR